MATLLAESERLLPLWDGIYEQTVTLRQLSYSSFSEEEQRYFDLLSRYVDAVRFTVVALVDRQRFMEQGTRTVPCDPPTVVVPLSMSVAGSMLASEVSRGDFFQDRVV